MHCGVYDNHLVISTERLNFHHNSTFLEIKLKQFGPTHHAVYFISPLPLCYISCQLWSFWAAAVKVLTCSVSQRGSCSETLLFCRSPNHSSFQMVSQRLWECCVTSVNHSVRWCIYCTNNCSNCSVNRVSKSQVPRSLFQSLMRTFAKAMTSSSVQCFLIPFTDMPILVS